MLRAGQLVPKAQAYDVRMHTPSGAPLVIGDIQPFRTIDGVEITSRSKLREYESRTGSRQIGNDWPGSTKPVWWDAYQDAARGRRR